MLWLKALHVIFVVTWFAGLFYLPRLFIYHLQAQSAAERERFVLMERRLLAITHIGGTLAAAFGLANLSWWTAHAEGYLRQGWLHGKFTLVLVLIAHHLWCVKLASDFRAGRPVPGDRWLRWFNEVPALLLVAIVLLVVLKPA